MNGGRGTNRTVLILPIILALSFHFSILPTSGDVEGCDRDFLQRSFAPAPNHPPITIRSDADFISTASAEGWVGSGNASDPFIIDGLIIDGGNIGHCLEIGFTDYRFVISNCTLYNGSYHSISAGIYISYCNGTLVNNTCFDNDYGIYLGSLSSVAIGNDCHNNSYGIFVPSHIGMAGGTIENNNVSYNSITGIKAWDINRSVISSNDCSFNENQGIYCIGADDCTISGNRLQGNDFGIYLIDCTGSNVSMNTAVWNNDHGIRMEGSTLNSFYGNYLEHNDDGFYIEQWSEKNSFTGNIIRDTVEYGIFIGTSNYNGFFRNAMVNCSFYLWTPIYYTEIPPNNTVNGRPVMHLEGMNMSRKTLGSDWGQVLIVGSRNVLLEGLDLGHGSAGMMVFNADNITLRGSSIERNTYHGLKVSGGSDVRVLNCSVSRNSRGAELFSIGGRLTVADCLFEDNVVLDLGTTNPSDLDVRHCHFTGGLYGLHISSSSTYHERTLSDNLFDNCSQYGLSFNGDRIQVSDNRFENLPYGIDLTSGAYNKLMGNTFFNCSKAIYLLESTKENIIEGNRILLSRSTGIYLEGTSLNRIYSNIVQDCRNGIDLRGSYSNSIKDNELTGVRVYGIKVTWVSPYPTGSWNWFYSNKMTGCSFYLENDKAGEHWSVIPQNNTVNGRPVYQIMGENMTGETFDLPAGQIILNEVIGLEVRDLDLTNITVGMIITDSGSISVRNVSISKAVECMVVDGAEDLTIDGCSFRSSTYGVRIRTVGRNVTLNSSHFENCTQFGVVGHATNTKDCVFRDNGIGTGQCDTGAIFTRNLFERNRIGIENLGHRAILSMNIFIENSGYAFTSANANGEIHDNAFCRNNMMGSEGAWIRGPQAYVEDLTNDVSGNFWDEMTSPDYDNDLVVDEPYGLDGSEKIDPRPLTCLPVKLLSPPPFLVSGFENGTVELHWDPSSSIPFISVDGYLIERSIDWHHFSELASVDGTEVQYRDNEPLREKNAQYRVYALSRIGRSAPQRTDVEMDWEDALDVGFTWPDREHCYINITDPVVRWNHTGWEEEVNSSLVLDNGIPIDVTGMTSYRLTGLSEGGHNLTIMVYDLFGYQGGDKATLMVDTIAPIVNITYPPDNVRMNVDKLRIEYSIDDPWLNDPDNDHFMVMPYILDDVQHFDNIYDNPIYIGDLSEGYHIVTLTYTDRAGNTGRDSLGFFVDLTPPDIASFFPQGDSVVTLTNITVEFSEPMDTGSVIIEVQGADGSLLSMGPTLFRSIPSGPLRPGKAYNVTVTGKDLAGNDMRPFNWTFKTACLGPSNEYCTLFGRVVDEKDRPLEGVEVSIKGYGSVLSNSTGDFIIKTPPGRTNISFFSKGYETRILSRSLEPGQVVDLGDVTLLKDREPGSSRLPLWAIILISLMVISVFAVSMVLYFGRAVGPAEE